MFVHNILQLLHGAALNDFNGVVFTQVDHEDPPPVGQKRICVTKHTAFPRVFDMLPEGGP